MKRSAIISAILAAVFTVLAFTAAPVGLAVGVRAQYSAATAPSPTGESVFSNTESEIDVSNINLGYLMIRYKGTSQANLKVRISGPSGLNYDYDLNTAGYWEVFPITDGSGSYLIYLFQNITGSSYAALNGCSVQVTLTDEFSPYLMPSQYVNFNTDTLVVQEARRLAEGKTTVLSTVEAMYAYVIENFTYDSYLAQTVQGGYVPNLDQIYYKKSGICFDYSAVLAAMLRSQGIPTRMVFGYTGTIYHAWINVYSNEAGWMNSLVFFDGTTWKLMDPTFASTAGNSSEINQYIGTGANYVSKYYY